MTRPSWTINASADLCGVSKSTVRRYLDAGRFPNAFKDTRGAWKIPIEDLLAVGWKPTDTPVTAIAETSQIDVNLRITELESALEIERVRRETAEQITAQIQANLADLRTALKMIEGRSVSAPESPVESVKTLPAEIPAESPAGDTNVSPEQPKRRWWKRS